MRKKFLLLFAVVSLLVAGVFSGFAVTGKVTANALDEREWNGVLELVVEVTVDSDAGFFEIEYEEIVSREDETERILEVCSPHFDGFICEEVELEEGDATIVFGFPKVESTFSFDSVMTACGLVDLDIVLPFGQGYETRMGTEFSPEHKPITMSKAVEIGSDESVVGEGITGTICGVELSSIVVFEASASMIREEIKERELD